MTEPKIIGRFGPDQMDARANTKHVHTVSVPFCSGAVGDATVSAFQSVGDADRGGIVLKIIVQDGGSSFFPFAKEIPNGIELHLTGEAEAKAMIHALKTALSTL